MDLHDDILRLSHSIAELAGSDEVEVEQLEQVIHDRDRLIRDYFAVPIPAESQGRAVDLIRTVLDLDATSSHRMRDLQHRIGEELGFMRRSHKAAGAYSATEQD